MPYIAGRSELERSIMNDAYGHKDTSANPIQIVPFPGGSLNPRNIQFTANSLENKYDIYDSPDIDQQYPHTGIFVASSSSTMNDDDSSCRAFNAFNTGGSGWKSSNIGASSIKNYDLTSNVVNTDSVPAYGDVRFGQSSYHKIGSGSGSASASVTKVFAGANNNGSAGSLSTTFSSTYIYGEWLQIQIPDPVYLYKYSIKVRPPDTIPNEKTNRQVRIRDIDTRLKKYMNGGTPEPFTVGLFEGFDDKKLTKTLNGSTGAANLVPTNTVNFDRIVTHTSHFPKVFTVAGSMDGSKWYYLDQQAFVNPPDLTKDEQNTYATDMSYNIGYGYKKTPGNQEVTFYVNSVDKYKYFRLIVGEMFPHNPYVEITKWSLFAFIDNFTPSLETKSQAWYEPFSNKKKNKDDKESSPEYVTGMNLHPTTIWDYFSNDIDTNLLNKYRDQKSTIFLAKENPDPLPTVEGFDSHGYKTEGGTTAVDLTNNKVGPLIQIYADHRIEQRMINSNYYDISNNLTEFNKVYGNLTTDLLYRDEYMGNVITRPVTKIDGWINDNKEIIMQQNSIYVLSTIAIASLVLALILVSK